MPSSLVLAIVTAGGLVSLLVLALRARGRVAGWLAAFVASLIVWNTADAVHHATGSLRWHTLDVSTSPLTIPLGLGFAAAFVERTRELRPASIVTWVWFGLLSLSSAAAFVQDTPLLPEDLWSGAFLIGLAGVVVLVTTELLRLMRRTNSDDERARARLVLVALPFAAVFGATDIASTFLPGVPELASIGVLGSALAMGFVALRWRLFGRELLDHDGARRAGHRRDGGRSVAARDARVRGVHRRDRHRQHDDHGGGRRGDEARRERGGSPAHAVEQLSTLGRAAAQMAHDMKNPLAAIRGAADVLVEGLARGEPVAELTELAAGIRNDADRMARLVEDYRRFVKVDPVLAPASLSAIVRTSARAASMWAPSHVECIALDCEDVEARFDATLVEAVVDGLARNAIEALDTEKGRVTLAVAKQRHNGVDGAAVVVEDDGPGMDAHTRGRATEDFFTTKATGSGLGLAFAQRVASAHRGALWLAPREGGGTRATLWLPLTLEHDKRRSNP